MLILNSLVRPEVRHPIGCENAEAVVGSNGKRESAWKKTIAVVTGFWCRRGGLLYRHNLAE